VTVNNASALHIQQTLDAWREQRSDRLDPVRFQLIQAMANRAAGLAESEAKRKLNSRLAELIQQYAAHVDQATTSAAHTTRAAAQLPSSNATLAGLIKHLEKLTLPSNTRTVSSSVGHLRERYPELPVLDEFRSTWSRVSANRQVRQSEEQVHENAGPLNSNHLVHRALSMMRDVSPGYLHQFLSYLDALAWVEQLQISSEPTAKDSKRGANKGAKSMKPSKATPSRAKRKAPKTQA